MRPADDPSWTSYFDTILVLGEAPVVAVDLRVPLTHEIRQAIVDRGFPRTFAVLTAHNPRGRHLSDKINAELHRDLTASLDAHQITHWPADGLSPDGHHREQGLVAALDRPSAYELARRFQQSAFFWYDGLRFNLVGALVAAPDTPLPAQ